MNKHMMPTADQLEWRPIDQLKPHPLNSRVHGEKQITELRASLRRFGWTRPVMITEGVPGVEDNTIFVGHGFIEAAKAEGYTTAKVLIARGWSAELVRAYMIADNQLPLGAEWNSEILKRELRSLAASGLTEGLGFSAKELRSLTLEVEDHDVDDAPDPPKYPVTKAGMMWALGDHRILCGDSTNEGDVSRLFDSGAAPVLMVTDPPYGVAYDAGWRGERRNGDGTRLSTGKDRARGAVANDDRADWQAAWTLFPGDCAYVWHADRTAQDVAASLKACGFAIRSHIIWAKSGLVVGRGHYHPQHETCFYAVREGGKANWQGSRKESTLWEIAKPRKSESGHSTQKPVECMRKPIENNSAEGDTVYDPFLGSGTTVIAAEMSARRCVAMEINPAYVDVAVQRWQTLTGQKATCNGMTFDAVAAKRRKEARGNTRKAAALT